MTTIVVVAKCPIPGQSKTRLIPLLGAEGAAQLADAMLSDVLTTLSQQKELSSVTKVLCYAPVDSKPILRDKLETLRLASHWQLVPLMEAPLTSSDLGDHLTTITVHLRETNSQQKILFLGMDAPELPIDEIISAINDDQAAVLCPSHDGGYGMLCLPAEADAHHSFQNIPWSHELTALAQIKALTDQGVSVRLGRLMRDMDEPKDVQELCERLTGTRIIENNILEQSSTGRPPETAECPLTRKALVDLGLLPETT